MRVHFLSGGTLDADRSVIHPADDSGRRVTLPVVQVLIQSDTMNILVDTGLPPEVAGDGEALKREYDIDPGWIRSLATYDERIDRQLRFRGLMPSDIDLVICTHFHFDHAGCNALFPGIPIAAQEAELIAARESEGYLPVWDAPGLQFRSVQGDWSPIPGVEMFSTPGHSPGHQSMLVRLSPRPWLFTFDAVYTEEHWREHKLGAVHDVVSAQASLERLRRIATEENARIIFGHDIAQWDALGLFTARGTTSITPE